MPIIFKEKDATDATPKSNDFQPVAHRPSLTAASSALGSDLQRDNFGVHFGIWVSFCLRLPPFWMGFQERRAKKDMYRQTHTWKHAAFLGTVVFSSANQLFPVFYGFLERKNGNGEVNPGIWTCTLQSNCPILAAGVAPRSAYPVLFPSDVIR